MDIDVFEKQIADYCAKLGLDEKDGPVLCAVSGGADSMCMLSALSNLWGRILCAHFDHRLRGDESERDALFVKSFCEKNSIEFYHGSGDVSGYAKDNGIGTEDAARSMRYAFLQETAEKTGAAYIATAHTAEDNMETMLMNLIRGAGSRGLAGIPPKRENIVRPILFVSREQVEEYLTARNIAWVEDSSNATDDYTRNKVRHHVIPELKEISPAAARKAFEAACLIREDDEYICERARHFIHEYDGIDVKALLELPVTVAARVFRIASGAELSQTHITALLELCKSDSPSACADLPGISAGREYGRLVFGREKSEAVPTLMIVPGKTVVTGDKKLKISAEIVNCCPEVYNSLNTFYFHIDSICGNISVRQRSAGDRIRFSGKGFTTSLKKLFIDRKIPKHLRSGIPVLADDRGPVAVYGFGISALHTAKPGQKALRVEIDNADRKSGRDGQDDK